MVWMESWVSLVLKALLVQKARREIKVIRALGWCFLKSIMGFSLLISSSLNAASLRGTKDKLDPLGLQGHQDPEVPQEILAKMVLEGCLAFRVSQESQVNKGWQDLKGLQDKRVLLECLVFLGKMDKWENLVCLA